MAVAYKDWKKDWKFDGELLGGIINAIIYPKYMSISVLEAPVPNVYGLVSERKEIIIDDYKKFLERSIEKLGGVVKIVFCEATDSLIEHTCPFFEKTILSEITINFCDETQKITRLPDCKVLSLNIICRCNDEHYEKLSILFENIPVTTEALIFSIGPKCNILTEKKLEFANLPPNVKKFFVRTTPPFSKMAGAKKITEIYTDVLRRKGICEGCEIIFE